MAASDSSNKIKILRLIRQRGTVSRAELARLSRLTRPTVSAIVRELESEKLVCETGKGESKGGKRPTLFELTHEQYYVIGVDLADEYLLRAVLCSLNGRILHREWVEYEDSRKFESIYSSLVLLIEKLLKVQDAGKIHGIGIAVSGTVDSNNNEIVCSSNFNIAGQRLAQKLKEHFDIPVLLENRPNAAALAEKQLGCGRRIRNLIYLSSGRGVGAGIIDEGAIFRGSFGTAGELGRILAPGSSSESVEQSTRFKALTQKLSVILGRDLTIDEIIKLYHKNEVNACAALEEHAKNLAYTAQIIANILNPQLLILGGRTVEFGDEYLKVFERYFNNGLTRETKDKTKVMFSRFGRDGAALGGAVIVLDRIMKFSL